MAFPQIETGYKPEFALGALYQGFNAGNADTMAQEDIIKNYLEQQRLKQQMNIEDYKENPEYKQSLMDMMKGQSMSNLAAGELSTQTLPQKILATNSELGQQAQHNNLFSKMYSGIQDQYNPDLSDEQRIAGGQQAFALGDTLSRIDPKIMAQERMLGQKLDSAEDIANARLAAVEALKNKAVAGDKTAQQALVKYWQAELVAGRISQQQYALELSSIFNAQNAAKIQPGIMVNPNVAPEVLLPKPAQQEYAPGANTPKADPLGIR